MKKKLMVVTPYFYPKIGGLENYAYNISKGLKEKYGWEIIVVTSNHEENRYKEEILDGLKIYRLPRQFKISNTPISFKWKRMISEIINKENPNIINAHSPVPFISDVACRIAKKKNIPFVLTYHSGKIIKDNFLINRIVKTYERVFLDKIFQESLKIIATSNWVNQTVLNGYHKKVEIITPAVNTSLFYPDNKNTKKNKIIFVGSLSNSERYKEIDYLLRGLNLIKSDVKFTCDIVGDGDLKSYYQDLIKSLKLEKQVKIVGKLFGEELAQEYRTSSLLVLPSSFDNFPIVLLEAMACKKPVIATNIGGIPEIVDNGQNGLLIPPKDPQAIANAITKILKNPKLAKKMGERGHKKVKERFNLETQTKNMNQLLDKIFR